MSDIMMHESRVESAQSAGSAGESVQTSGGVESGKGVRTTMSACPTKRAILTHASDSRVDEGGPVLDGDGGGGLVEDLERLLDGHVGGMGCDVSFHRLLHTRLTGRGSRGKVGANTCVRARSLILVEDSQRASLLLHDRHAA